MKVEQDLARERVEVGEVGDGGYSRQSNRMWPGAITWCVQAPTNMPGFLIMLSWAGYREDEDPGLGEWGDCWVQFLRVGSAERKTLALSWQWWWFWEGRRAPGFTSPDGKPTAFFLLPPPTLCQHFNLKIQYSAHEDRLQMTTSLDR